VVVSMLMGGVLFGILGSLRGLTAVLIMVDPEANNLRGRTSLSRLLS
jgi:hypothetical protein